MASGNGQPGVAPIGRVLIVDDDDLVRRGIGRVVKDGGFEIEAVASGREALRSLDAGRFDVVLSDISMPSLSGLELLREVRARGLELPVVLMTGTPGFESAVEAVEHGAFGYLVKPIEADALTEKLRRAVSVHRLSVLRREAWEVAGKTGFAVDRVELGARLDRAIASLWMAFQPIVLPAERRVYSYEALVRSIEPTLPGPGELFEAAERLGRVHHVGRMIRRRVAEAAPQAPADVLLFVNVHPDELADDELLSERAPLSAHAGRVVLEITERSTLDRVAGLGARMTRLRELGYRIAVDDLGAGYAGLSSFSQLEPDVVKLDMSLIRGVDASPRKRSVVRSIAQLCRRDLGIRVVCEGVETRVEHEALAADGIDLLQGYLFARPARGFPTPTW
jgi:EAL domain-containing protein (putative c-di-GMP-specific phosphodiesterase class I)